MLHACVRRFDMTGTVEIFSGGLYCLLAWIDAVLMFLKVAYPTSSNEMREVGRAVGSDLVRAYSLRL